MPDIFDTITIPKKDIFDTISLPNKRDIFDTLGTPKPQPLPPPTRQEQLAKESNDYGFNLLTGTASEAGKEAYSLAKKTFSPFDIRNVTDPIAEVLSREVMSGKPPIQAYKDMGKGVARTGYDTLQGLSHAVGDPLGTTDIASGDLTFPIARQAWRERPYESAVGVSPILTPLLMKGISAIPRRQPEIKISPEAKRAYTSGIQEIGQTLKNIPDEVRPQQARVVADLRNQMRSALFKDDVATINSIVADFREGQTIPTAQPPQPTLNIPTINATTLREKNAKIQARQKTVIPETPEYQAEMAKLMQQQNADEFPFGENALAAIPKEMLEVLQTENIFQQVKKITSAIKIDKGFFDHFDRTEVRPMVQKSPGLFSTKKGMPLDEVADGLGISTDELADKLRDAVSKKEETELLKKQIQEYRPPTEPLPKPENVEIVKPQPKGFTPIEAAPAVSKEPWQMTREGQLLESQFSRILTIESIPQKKAQLILDAGDFFGREKGLSPRKKWIANLLTRETAPYATGGGGNAKFGVTEYGSNIHDTWAKTNKLDWVEDSGDAFNINTAFHEWLHTQYTKGTAENIIEDKANYLTGKFFIEKHLSEGKPVPPEVLKEYPELQKQTHTMPSGEVMPGAEHAAGIASPEGSLQMGKVKYAQPKMFEGEKANIKPQMEADIQGQRKMFEPKAGQLTPEQFKEQIADVNIGREGKPSIKSEAPIRYAPGTSINLETLDLPIDVKSHIYKLTQQYQPQFEDARNRKTWEEINKEAESSGFDTQQLLERQKGEAYNAAKLKATKDIQNNTALETKRIVDESVRLLKDATLTEDQQSEILVIANMKMKKAAAILAQANGAYSEAGRALNILRQVTSVTKAEKNWKAILDVLGGREMTLDIFKKIAGMDTADTPQVARFIREIQKAKTPDMVMEVWRNAILSGTKTLITNPLSNAITFLSNPIETGIAATLEKGRSLITGKKPQVYYREIPAELAGAIDGIWNGTRVFLNTMKTEIPTFGETKIETVNKLAIPGKIGQVVRVPQTILMAQDDFAKAIIYDSTIKAMATRYGIRKGLKGRELVDFVGNLLSNPQGRNKKIYDLFDKRARAEADYRTYNKALGKIGQMVMRLREVEIPPGSGIKPIYYILPFIRTPTNILKYGLERTPLNFARLGYKTYKNEIQSSQISEEFAKPVLGTIIALWGWLMFEYGYMTGDAPKDDTDRKTWYNAGKKPYSFYIPWLNRYISYQRIEPLGSILGSVADFFENTHRGVKNTKDAFTKILLSIVRNWSNKTFILGATNAINAYTDPERYGDRFVDGLGSSVIPNIISSFNPDPYYRQKETFLDSIKAKIPVLSETLLPQRDILGEPAKRGESRGSALMNQILPFGVTKPSDDLVRQELLRLNDSISFSVGMPNKYFMINKQKIEIPPNVYDDYSKESGELAYKLIKRIVGSKNYKSMEDDKKAVIVRKQFDIARDYIRPKYINQLRLKHLPQIGR